MASEKESVMEEDFSKPHDWQCPTQQGHETCLCDFIGSIRQQNAEVVDGMIRSVLPPIENAFPPHNDEDEECLGCSVIQYLLQMPFILNPNYQPREAGEDDEETGGPNT
jgi:hypothetical protein